MTKLFDSDPMERMMAFREAATTGEFPSLLREDYQDILLKAYSQVPQGVFPLYYRQDSLNETETHRGMTDLGPTTQKVPQGGEFPERMLSEKSTKSITNYKYGDIVSYTREMGLYNKLQEFKDLSTFQGEALAQGLEENATDILETSGNYTAYGSTVTLSRANLEAMLTFFKKQTTTDAEGRTVRLNLIPDTLLVPIDLEDEAIRLTQSPQIPGSANNDINTIKRAALNVVVGRCLASTSVFYLVKSNSPIGLRFQSVIGPPPETFTQDVKGAQMPDSSFRYDKISYRADMIYGLGQIDAKTVLRSTS